MRIPLGDIDSGINPLEPSAARVARSGIGFPVETPEERQQAYRRALDTKLAELARGDYEGEEGRAALERDIAHTARMAGVNLTSYRPQPRGVALDDAALGEVPGQASGAAPQAAPRGRSKPPTWDEVLRRPEMQRLSADEIEAARNQYFLDVVAPLVPTEQLKAAREAFDADTKPGPIQRAIGALKDAAKEIEKEGIVQWLRPGPPTTEFGKGVETGVTGAHQMVTAAAMIPFVSALQHLDKTLAAYDEIDLGRWKPTVSKMGKLPSYAEEQARLYARADPETRKLLRENALRSVAENTQIRDALLSSWKTYSDHIRTTQGRVPNFSDAKDAKDYADWFAFNFGQGLPYTASFILSGLLGGTPALMGAAGVMGAGDIASEQLEKRGEINPSEAVTGAVPYAAMEFVGVPLQVARAFRGIPRETLERLAKSYFMRLGREVPEAAGREFLNEAGQEIVKDLAIAQKGEPIVTEEALKRWFNSGMGGLAGGAPFGAISAIPGPKRGAEPPPTEQQPAGKPEKKPGFLSRLFGRGEKFESGAEAEDVLGGEPAQRPAQPAAPASEPAGVESMLADPNAIFQAVKAKPAVLETVAQAMRDLPEYKQAAPDVQFDLDAAVRSIQADPKEIFRLAAAKPGIYATVADALEQNAKLKRGGVRGSKEPPAGSPEAPAPEDRKQSGQARTQGAVTQDTGEGGLFTGTKPLDAVWTSAGVDRPVKVTRFLGTRDGEDYFEIEGSDAGIPGRELKAPAGALEAFKERAQAEARPEEPLKPPQFVRGRKTQFATERGSKLEGEFAVVDADELVTSHDTALNENPRYPRELQPRDRSRNASDLQVARIAQNLQPDFLAESPQASQGAPIVGPDGIVESGNARSIALKRAYDADAPQAQAYREWLAANAERFGLDPQALAGVKKPVLVRIRTTDVNRAEFARQANESSVAQLSPLELARADAARLKSLDDLAAGDNGELNTAQNMPFIRRFIGLLPVTEQSALVTATGELSQAGMTRMRNAILAKAYGGGDTLMRMVESPDNNIRNITHALVKVAPRVAKARESIAAGALHDLDITEDLLKAVESLSRLRADRKDVGQWLAQISFFEAEASPEFKALLTFLDENSRSPRRIAEFIELYLASVEAAGSPAQGSMFGEQVPTRSAIIEQAKKGLSREPEQSDLLHGREGAAAAPAGERQEARGGGGRTEVPGTSQPQAPGRQEPAGEGRGEGGARAPEGAVAEARKSPAAAATEQAFGATNKVFTADAAARAREVLRKKLGQINVGLDPEVVQAGIQLAGFYIEGGARKFADFSAKMIADLGEAVRPYLKSWYLAVRNYPGFDSAGMQSEAEIEAIEKQKEKSDAIQEQGTDAGGVRRVSRPRDEGEGEAVGEGDAGHREAAGTQAQEAPEDAEVRRGQAGEEGRRPVVGDTREFEGGYSARITRINQYGDGHHVVVEVLRNRLRVSQVEGDGPSDSAAAARAFERAADYVTAGTRWDGASVDKRIEWVTRKGWVTANGYITGHGQKIAESPWTALSPAAQRLLKNAIAEDEGREPPQTPEAERPAAPESGARPEIDELRFSAKARKALAVLRDGGYFRKQLERVFGGREQFVTRLRDKNGTVVPGIGPKTFFELQKLLRRRDVPSGSTFPEEWVLSESETERPAAEPGKKLSPDQVAALATEFSKTLLAGTALGSINEARTIAARELKQPIKPGTVLAKQTDEALELGIVLAAREIVKRMRAQGATDKEIYAALVDLYERQPNLAVRTSTSVRDQAYSTPVPLAFLASRLAGIDEHTRVLEPTAGNGMLLIEADPDRAVANELNSDRAAALEAQGFTPSRIDATALPSMEKVDAVIANPPFGYVKDEQGRNREWKINERYTTNQIDHAIALKALEAMADDGRAVLIVAAPHDLKAGEARAEAYNGRNLRAFYFTLYGAYNVVDHFTVAGDLYARQGAAWPVDVLVISGRGKSARTLPAAQVPKLYESWEELAEKLDVARRLDETTRGARRPSTEAAAQGARERAPEPAALGGGAARAEGPVQRPGGGGPAPVRGGRAAEQPAAGGLDVGAHGEPREPARTGELPGADRGPDTGVPRQLEDVEKAPSRRPISTRFKAGDKVRFRSPSTNQQVYEIWQVSDDGARLKLHEPAPKHWRNAEDFELVEARPLDETEKVQREQVVRRREAETEHQVHYEPSSKVSSIGTLVPANMKSSIAESLAALKERVGDLDEYVAKELDYPVGHIGRYFSAEQVDALALALDALGKRAGFIVGDATGVGKGRVVAGMIRWAMKHGKTPIFVTEKPNLYGDMVRDLTDIGMPHVRILMTNSNAEIPLDDEAAAWWAEWEEEALAAKAAGERPRRRPPVESRPGKWLKTTAQQPKVLQEVMEKGSLGDYDVIFTTYSQMQTVQGKRTVRMDFLERFVQGGMLIMDESHNAGGDAQESDAEQAGRRGDEGLKRSVFARGLIRLADGVFYSSATYAKRPEVMDLYAATDMALAVDSPAALPEAIRAGGVPLQQVVASMLAKAGQYIRRERSFAGVRYDTRTVAVNREIAERISGLMRAISAFDTAKAPAIARMRKEIRKEAKQVTQDGSAGEAGVSSTNFTSIMHNMVNQMLLALKVVPVADLAIEVAKRGERPVLTVANTMGSFIKAYVEEHELKAGDRIAISFKDLLLRYLERSREVLVGDPFGKKERHRLTDEELGVAAVNLYNRIREDILASDFSEIPLSPIDYLKHRIERAGLTFGEITGRHHRIDYSGPEPIYTMRPASDSSVAGRRVTIKKFNDGLIDVLLLNQAGATGLSLHASEKFKDQRRRHMIIVQAEANIDTHMQMLGRVHRTGQVVEPVYTQLVADIPAEKRPAAVLAKKMASLNANTTAARGSALTARQVVDFMNEYGDETAAQLMEDHEEWHKIMGSPLKGDDEGAGLSRKDAIRKLTGRIPLLRIAEQEELYNMLEDEYRALVEEKDRLGENLLEAKTRELDAKVLKAVPITQGKGGSSPFAAGATAEIVDVKKIGKPFTSEELLGILRRELGQPEDAPFSVLSRAGIARAEELRESLAAEWQPYVQETLDSLHDQRHRDATGARLRGAYERLDHILAQAALGRPLVLDTRFGKVPAVVTKVEKKGNPKNPAALGAWKFTFAVADAIRRVTIPASRMYAAGDQPQNAVDTGYVVLDEYRPGDWGGKRTLELFDEAQSHSREQRVIITGNLLAGFGKFSNGQIIHFTTDSGEIRQGILMPRRFDVDRALNTMPIEFPNAESAIGFLDRMAGQAVLESVEEKLFRLTGSGNEYRLVVAKAREKGGVIYLNKEIIRAAGRDFVSAGASMRLDEMDRQTAVKVLQAIMDAGHRVHTKAFRQEAKDYLEANAPRTEGPAFQRQAGTREAGFRREAAVAGMPVRRVRELADRISGAWANAPRFVVTKTPAQWPFDAPDDAKGAFWRGTVYLAADHLAGERDVQFTVFHETLGHYGLRGFFGKDLDPVLRELWIRDTKLRRAAADWMSKNEKRPEWSAEDYRLQAIEEALADLAGSGRTFNGLRKLIVKIQDWLRRHGFDWVADWLERLSDAEALSVLAQARSFVTEGGKAHIYTPELEASLSRLGRWYYSELAKQIAGLTLKTAPPAQWRGIIQNLKGVKKEEVEWTGVLDWLAMQQGTVSREAVLDYLASNGVRVEEVALDTRESVERDAERAADELHARGYSVVYDEVADGVSAPVAITRRSDDQSYTPGHSLEGGDLPLSELPPNIREMAERLFRETEQKRERLVVRYETYTLPGGKNYRELLLKLPSHQRVDARDVAKEFGYGPDEPLPREVVDEIQRRIDAADRIRDAEFESPHWDVSNILAHIRLNERTDSEGARVLFIEEIQSDWSQQGMRRGFSRKLNIDGWQAQPDGSAWRVTNAQGGYEGRAVASSAEFAIQQVAAVRASGIPRAPFVTKTESWVSLALKRMIRYAAENGFEKIAWTTGEQQAERYDLSKHIAEIIYERIDGPGEPTYVITGRQRTRYGYKSVDLGAHSAAELPKVVGKEIAARIIRGEGKPAAEVTPVRLMGSDKVVWEVVQAGRLLGEFQTEETARQKARELVKSRLLEGLDLKMGGHGMRAFYDRIVPNVANDVLKKLGGGRVIPITIKIGREKSEQPGFEITPALRERAMAGMPLFARREQAPRESWIESYRQAARKALDRLEATFEPIRRLPQAPQYLKDRYLALGKIAKVDEIARGIRSAFSEATEEDKRAAYEYLTTFDATPDAIKDPAVRAKAAEVKRLINSVGDALVARWMLSPEAREAHRDAYLPRLYLRHLLTEADWKALGSGKKVSDMGYLKQRKDIPE
ncbi:MAG TPA: strawberry notch C-terminal domain-containing protein, partial [Burkholderiales bacterium]|nr:strawberry notch C-terminal domain-containing protein [Burkholderiales bacterium]